MELRVEAGSGKETSRKKKCVFRVTWRLGTCQVVAIATLNLQVGYMHEVFQGSVYSLNPKP